MKKAISLLIALVLCLMLFACSGGDESSETTEDPMKTTETPAETIESANTETEETETTVLETTEPTANTSWVLDYFVDDFGDKEDGTYIKCETAGDFSNTATMSSDLSVIIFFIPGVASEENTSGFCFRLFEYGDKPATYLSDDEITIKIKVGDEIITEELYGTAPNGDLLLAKGPMLDKLTHTLPTEDQEIRCIIEIGSSKYNFTIPVVGYTDSFNAMMQSYGFEGYDVVEALNGKLFTRTID